MALSGIGELPLFKRRNTGTEELEALLDLLPHPTLVANGRSGHVLFANAQATQLTAFTRRELAELEIRTLLPQYPLSGDTGAHEPPASVQTLVTRSSRSLQVKVKTEKIGGQEHWVAIVLLPPTEEEGNTEALNQQRWEAMHMLANALQQEEVTSSYRHILQAGALLIGTNYLAIYLPSKGGDALSLDAVFGEGIDLPAELVDSDLGHLRTPKVWQAGKPIESTLHKLAKSANLSFLATTPLDLTDPNAGLLVSVQRDKPAPKGLTPLMQVVAATILTAKMNADLADRLRSELGKLHGSEEVRAALQENVQDGLLFADEDFKILDLNPAAEAMLGYVSAEVRGRPADDILVSTQSLLPALELALRDRHVHDIGERKIHKRDGSEFLVSLRIVPIQAGKAMRLAVFFTDLSEHEAFHMQNQQLQQRAAIGEITAIFAHEVRNPINSISTGLQLMQINLPEQDPLQEQIKKLQEDVDRLEHRMKSVDAFSRNVEPHPEPLDLGAFCQGQLDRWRPRMTRKNIKDHIQIAPGTPLILGDRRALDQVLTNLITNAIQAMEEQGEGILAIKIRPNPDDETVVDLHLSDSGPGIPEDVRKRMFQPFFTTKGEEGTGLGLAITRRIVMAHKGKIECESFPGGTLFKIQLPVAPASEGNPA